MYYHVGKIAPKMNLFTKIIKIKFWKSGLRITLSLLALEAMMQHLKEDGIFAPCQGRSYTCRLPHLTDDNLMNQVAKKHLFFYVSDCVSRECSDVFCNDKDLRLSIGLSMPTLWWLNTCMLQFCLLRCSRQALHTLYTAQFNECMPKSETIKILVIKWKTEYLHHKYTVVHGKSVFV